MRAACKVLLMLCLQAVLLPAYGQSDVRRVAVASLVWKGEGAASGGQYYFDAALQKAPDEFRRYAALL